MIKTEDISIIAKHKLSLLEPPGPCAIPVFRPLSNLLTLSSSATFTEEQETTKLKVLVR